jgi:hypothetical protein
MSLFVCLEKNSVTQGLICSVRSTQSDVLICHVSIHAQACESSKSNHTYTGASGKGIQTLCKCT